MREWFLTLAVVLSAVAVAQEKPTVGGFTKSPTEHIINRIEQPFLVQSVKGVISLQTVGPTKPLANVLFEETGGQKPGDRRNVS